ncbi:MAG: hypothetical protein QXU74_04000 [Candidatus Aenigmatarchaeota archaeon]|nr:hypothetical protein [Archaeoglobales archaeon]
MREIIKPEPFPLVSSFNERLRKFDPIISKMLAKKKEDRYRSIEEFIRDLNLFKQRENKSMLLSEIESILEKISKSREIGEIKMLKKELLEKICDLAISSAKLDEKSELLGYLEKLKDYTEDENLKRNIDDLTEQSILMIRENITIDQDFINILENVVNRVRESYVP